MNYSFLEKLHYDPRAGSHVELLLLSCLTDLLTFHASRSAAQAGRKPAPFIFAPLEAKYSFLCSSCCVFASSTAHEHVNVVYK